MDRNEAESKSRTQRKKEAQDLQLLGEKLVDLPEGQIEPLELPEKLHKAVMDAKQMKKNEALRRQLQYIGGLMRGIDPQPIIKALDGIAAGRKEEARKHKHIEDLRDGLISGVKDLQKDVLDHFPEADRQHLAQLIRNARKEKALEKPPKSARNLFRYLRDL